MMGDAYEHYEEKMWREIGHPRSLPKTERTISVSSRSKAKKNQKITHDIHRMFDQNGISDIEVFDQDSSHQKQGKGTMNSQQLLTAPQISKGTLMIGVKFVDMQTMSPLDDGDKEYSYKTDLDVKVNDIVLVQARGGVAIARVVNLTPDYQLDNGMTYK